MFCYFVGGAVGSVAAGAVLAAWGWDGVCVLGAVFGTGSLVMAGFDRFRPTRSFGTAPAATAGRTELRGRELISRGRT